MNKKIVLLASTSLLVLTPITYNQVFGDLSSQDARLNTAVVDTQKSDSDITRQVKNEIQNDNITAKFFTVIEVKTEKGVVTLSGKVDTEKAKSDIKNKTANVAGVVKVVDLIIVTPTPAK